MRLITSKAQVYNQTRKSIGITGGISLKVSNNKLSSYELFGCDTMVALPNATVDGHTLFAKNSDRQSEECQPLTQTERLNHNNGESVNCDFTNIPQVDITYGHVGSRPYWCWGYEHGFNEHQVVIGNEAVRSRLPMGKEPRLTGMDLVRLGLERGKTAAESVDVITELIAKHGQGRFVGNSEYSDYDNGFIVADPSEAYIIESAGHEWAVKPAVNTIGISNTHSIATDWMSLSNSAEETAINNGWFEPKGDRFNFRDAYMDFEKTFSGSGPSRRSRLCTFLDSLKDAVGLQDMMKLVRDHSDGSNPGEPHRTTMPSEGSVCMHHTSNTKGNTAATLIAHLCDDGSRLPIYWCSFYSPCLGIFLPTFSEATVPSILSIGDKEMDDRSPWWLFRQLEKQTRKEMDFDEEKIALIRNTWAPIQDSLIESSYLIATEANTLIRADKPNEAYRLVNEYMTDNANVVLSEIRRLLSVINAVPITADNY